LQANTPNVIIANTIKGKGVPFMENNKEWHHNHLTDDQYKKAIVSLGGNVDGI
jgi:transketolase